MKEEMIKWRNGNEVSFWSNHTSKYRLEKRKHGAHLTQRKHQINWRMKAHFSFCIFHHIRFQ